MRGRNATPDVAAGVDVEAVRLFRRATRLCGGCSDPAGAERLTLRVPEVDG